MFIIRVCFTRKYHFLLHNSMFNSICYLHFLCNYLWNYSYLFSFVGHLCGSSQRLNNVWLMDKDTKSLNVFNFENLIYPPDPIQFQFTMLNGKLQSTFVLLYHSLYIRAEYQNKSFFFLNFQYAVFSLWVQCWCYMINLLCFILHHKMEKAIIPPILLPGSQVV